MHCHSNEPVCKTNTQRRLYFLLIILVRKILFKKNRKGNKGKDQPLTSCEVRCLLKHLDAGSTEAKICVHFYIYEQFGSIMTKTKICRTLFVKCTQKNIVLSNNKVHIYSYVLNFTKKKNQETCRKLAATLDFPDNIDTFPSFCNAGVTPVRRNNKMKDTFWKSFVLTRK